MIQKRQGRQDAAIGGLQDARGREIRESRSIMEPTRVSRAYLRSSLDQEDVFVFQRNPMETNTSRGANYLHQEVPWISHPIPQFKNGQKEPISFNLEMIDNCRNEKDPNQILAAYAWLSSKTTPVRDASNKMLRQPELLILVIGEYVERVRVESVKLKVKRFYPSMKPREAVISVNLFVAIQGHRNPSSILQRYGFA